MNHERVYHRTMNASLTAPGVTCSVRPGIPVKLNKPHGSNPTILQCRLPKCLCERSERLKFNKLAMSEANGPSTREAVGRSVTMSEATGVYFLQPCHERSKLLSTRETEG